MADNVILDPGVGGETLATDQNPGGSSEHYQIIKIAHGPLNTFNLASTTSPLPVDLRATNAILDVDITAQTGGDLTIADGGNVISVDDAGGSLTVDNGTLAVTGGGLEATALRVTLASDSTGTLSIDDGGGTLTVDGTVTANAGSGTMTVTDDGSFTLAANSGTDIGDVDVTSVVPGTGATQLGKARDGAAGATDTGVAPLAIRDDALSALTPIEGDYEPLRIDAEGALWVQHSGDVTIADGGNSITVDGTVTVTDGLVVDLGANNDVTVTSGNITVDLGVNNDVVVTDIVPGVAATNLGKAIDSVAGGTDTGVAILAVRDDGLSALTPVEGDYVPLRVGSTGALHVTGGGGGAEFAQDSVAGGSDLGSVALVVRNDAGSSLVDTDGDYAALSVNASGALYVTGGGGGTEYVVNAVVPADPTGTASLMERDDALTTLTEVEGDWTNQRANARGAMWVEVDPTNPVIVDLGANNDVTVTGSVTANAGTGTFNVTDDGSFTLAANSGVDIGDVDVTSIVPGIGPLNLGKAEDLAHSSSDVGVMALAVRRDGDTPFSGADNDYAPLAVDANGNLKVEIFDGGDSHTVDGTVTANAGTGTFTVTDDGSFVLAANSGVDIGDVDITSLIPGTAATNLGKQEDEAHTTGDVGVMSLAVRRDADTSLVGTDGDYAPLIVNASGALKTEIFDGGDTLSVNTELPTAATLGDATANPTAPGVGAFGHSYDPIAGDWNRARCWALSTNNSTTATLGSSATFTGTGDDLSGYSTVTVTIEASHDGATDGMTFQFSPDNTNWDDIYAFNYVASEGSRRFQFPVTAQFFRLVFTNGGTGQTHFRVQTILHNVATITSIHRLADDVGPDRSAQLMKTTIVAQASGSGDFVPVSANATGKLQVAAELEVATAHDDADAENPLKVGGRAQSDLPTNVTNNDRTDANFDLGGRQVTRPFAPRELTGKQHTTLTSTTAETTIVAAGAAGVFRDISGLILSNESTTECRVDIADATAGADVLSVDLAADGGGAVMMFPIPLPQATAANNWTATCSASVASIYITALYVENN